MITPSGISSIPTGLETPDIIELRKRKEIEDLMEAGSETPALFTVMHEKKTNVGGAMMGSSHVYDINMVVFAFGLLFIFGPLSYSICFPLSFLTRFK